MSDSTTKTELIAKFEKKPGEEVRVSIDEFKGHRLINIRVWYTHPETREMLPGKQGITLAVEKIDALKTAVGQLAEKLK